MRLRTIAEVAIQGSGLGIEPNCRQDLDTMLDSAELKLLADPQRRSEAVMNTLKLVAGMIQEARDRNAMELHEWSLGGALGKLCPLFPFC
jgi:hypothetical protein